MDTTVSLLREIRTCYWFMNRAFVWVLNSDSDTKFSKFEYVTKMLINAIFKRQSKKNPRGIQDQCKNGVFKYLSLRAIYA